MSEKAPYTGPIEHVKPGDILSWERHEEYREFMLKKKGIRDARLWSLNETWIDNGSRPFQIAIKPEIKVTTRDINNTPNPFDE